MKVLARMGAPLVVAAVVLTACGGGGKPAAPPASAPAGQQTAVQPAADPNKPVQGGHLVRALNYGDPGNLDPIVKSEVAAQMVTMHLFSRLLKYDPVAKKLEGDLAEKWEISGDGKTYTLTLRKGATFHNGREVKAADVKYSFERLANPKNASPAANALLEVAGFPEFKDGKATEISGIKVEGDHVVRIALSRVRPTFLMNLTSVPLSIVPKEEVEKLGQDFGFKPVGSGPFTLAAWTKDEKIVLRANDKYYAGRPYLDQVTYRIMKEEATRDAEFQTGNLDMMTAGESVYKKYSADPKYKNSITEVPELFTRAIFFNLKEKPFDDVRVRQAINYAIDKKVVVEKVLNNKAYPAVGPLQSSSPGFNPNLKGYEYNPDKARDLLKQAGLTGGFEMEVIATAAGAKVVEGLIPFLQEVGIKVKIVQLESTTLFSRARSGQYKAVYFSTGGDVDPVGFLEARLHSKNHGNAGNITFYSNPDVDKLLDEAQSITDQGRRIELARKAEEMVVKDAPWFFFNYNKAVIIQQPWVKGLQPVPTDIDFQDLTKVWITAEKPKK